MSENDLVGYSHCIARLQRIGRDGRREAFYPRGGDKTLLEVLKENPGKMIWQRLNRRSWTAKLLGSISYRGVYCLLEHTSESDAS